MGPKKWLLLEQNPHFGQLSLTLQTPYLACSDRLPSNLAWSELKFERCN